MCVGKAESMEARVVPAATAITVAASSSGMGVYTFQYNNGTSMFNAPVMSSSIGSNSDIGMGDVDGDGDEDLVQLSRGALINYGFGGAAQTFAKLEVALRNSTGGFGALQTWATNIPLSPTSGGSTWTDLKVGNFRGTANDDVLMRNRETGEWRLWESTGTGAGATSLASQQFGTWNTGFQWRDVMTGDFDGDGYKDIVGRQIANAPMPGGAPVNAQDNWYIGRGNSTTSLGTVGAADSRWWLYTQHAHSMVVANAVVGNFNHATGQVRKDDLAIRFALNREDNGSRKSLWMNTDTNVTGVNNSVPTNTLANAWSITVGALSYSPMWDHALAGGIEQHWRDVQAGDVTGSADSLRRDDILGRTASDNWVMSPGGGNSSSTASVANWSGTQFAGQTALTGDFDGDLKLDLIVRGTSMANQWFRSQFGTTSFTTPVAAGGMAMFGTPSRQRSFVNGVSTPVSQNHELHKGDLGSHGPLAPLEDVTRWNAPSGMGTDPFFSQGRYNSDGTFNFEDTGGGVPTSPAPFSAGSGNGMLRGDFTGDGLQDVLTQGINASSPNAWYLLRHTGNAFVSIAVPNIPQTWVSFNGAVPEFRIGNFGGDAKADLLVQIVETATTSRWELYVGNGNGFTTAGTVITMNSTVSGWLTGGALGDFNGDGLDDLAMETFTSMVNGVSTYTTHVVYAGSWTRVGAWTRTDSTVAGGTRLFFIESHGDRLRVGDVNGDGKDDVLALQNRNTTTLPIGEVWIGYGGGGSAVALQLPAPFDFNAPKDRHVFEVGRFAKASATATGNDNLADIVINPSDNISLLRVYRSTGGTFAATPAFTGPMGPYGLLRPVVSDIDRDGYDDLVWGSTGYNVSLFNQANVRTWMTPNTGFFPGPTSAWMGHSTKIARLRRRRG